MQTKPKPAPASAEARATRADRQQFLEQWALANPLATIEQAREAVRARYGLSLGSEVISRTMRLARGAWESRRQAAARTDSPQPEEVFRESAEPPPARGGSDLTAQIQDWARVMRASGIRLIEVLPDGGIRFELSGR